MLLSHFKTNLIDHMLYAMITPFSVDFDFSVDASTHMFFTTAILPRQNMAPIIQKCLANGVQHFIVPLKLMWNADSGFMSDICKDAKVSIDCLKVPVKLKGSNESLPLVYFRIGYNNAGAVIRYTSHVVYS